MAWLNLDINGCEIESGGYCPECDKGGIEFDIVPAGPYFERMRCSRCGWVYPYLFDSREGIGMQYYLLQNSDWDEGVSPFDKAREEKRKRDIADLFRI